jgi:hypothetical protein
MLGTLKRASDELDLFTAQPLTISGRLRILADRGYALRRPGKHVRLRLSRGRTAAVHEGQEVGGGMMRRGLGIAFLCAIVLAVTACGSSGSSSSSGGSSGSGGSSSGSSASVSGAKVLPATALTNPPKGTITYCTGKDTTGAAHYVVSQFNAAYGSQGYHANLVEFPASADQQRPSSSSASRRNPARATSFPPT